MSARRLCLSILVALGGLALVAPAARAQTGTITTVAGGGPNNLPKLSANLNFDTTGLALDKNGNFYLASESDNRIYEINAAGTLTIFAGTGARGYGGDNGPATSAALNSPVSVAVDGSNNVFIADTGNLRIRRVDAVTHTITTVAGNGTSGSAGNGGPATSAELSFPFGVYVDGSGNIFISELFPNLIQEVVAATGDIQIVAGNGTQGYTGDGGPATSAELGEPYAVSGDASGNIYIADATNSVIREVYCTNTAVVCTPPVGLAANDINTVAGTGVACPSSTTSCGDGGPATSAQLNFPEGVFVDGSGNIFIADSGNSRIREVGVANRTIQTVAGTGTAGFSGDGGSAVSAELSNPFTVLVDGTGNIYIQDVGNVLIREVIAATGNIQTFAGNGFPQFSGDGYPATDAALDQPAGATSDGNSNLYVSDSNNDVVREVDATTGNINTIAGNAALGCGYAGDNGPATSAQFCGPRGVFVDSFGNIYIVDSDNEAVREVVFATGNIQTIAGGGTGCDNGSLIGDGCPATSATLNAPTGVFVDGFGNVFIADVYDNAIREVYCTNPAITTCTAPGNFSPGDINTVVGGGQGCGNNSPIGDGCPATSAELNDPSGVYLDSSGNIYVADTVNAVIRVVSVSTGIIQTVAGTPQTFGYSGDGGPATSAETSGVDALVVDAVGNIFFVDCGGFTEEESCNNVVREVVASTGKIQTVAGTGTYGFSGDGGPATSAELDEPLGIGFDPAGNVLIPDLRNNRLRSVAGLATVIVASAAPATVPFGSVPEYTPSGSMNVTLTNNGIFPLNFSSAPSVSGTSDFAVTGGTCAVGTPVAAYGGSCTVTLTFTPSTVGMESATLNFSDNAMPATQSAMLTGTGTPPPAPAVMLSPTALAFGVVPVGMNSTLSVTVKNTGNAALFFSQSTAISGPNAADFAVTSDGCSDFTIQPNGTCMVAVTFTPSVATPETAVLTFTDNATPSTQTVSLAGGGPGFTLTVPPPATGGTGITISVLPGDTAVYTLALTCTPGVTGTVTLAALAPLPPYTLLTITPSMITCPTNGTVLVTVKVQTNCTTSLVAPPAGGGWPPPSLPQVPAPLAAPGVLAFLTVLMWRKAAPSRNFGSSRPSVRSLVPACAALLLVLLVMTWTACVSNPPPAIPNAPTTPMGTYQLTIVGTGPTGAQVTVLLNLHII